MVSNEYLDFEQKIHFPNKDEKITFRPSAYIICKNNENKILLTMNERFLQWEFPGGGLEIGEELNECILREVKEETGYDIKLTSELPFFIEKDLSYSKKKKKYTHEIHFYFEGKLNSNIQGKQNFAEGENIIKVKFFNLDEIKKINLIWWQKKAFQKYLEIKGLKEKTKIKMS